VISARRTDGNDRTLGLKLTLDSLTGASPNGAAPQPTAQTFTSPSGNSSYTTPAGAVPLDTSFRDRRVALAGSLERPWGDAQRLSLGANLSVEYDFVSASVNAALARDFNQKNTTVSLGLALETNRIKAVGGAPVGLQSLGGSNIERMGQQTAQRGRRAAGRDPGHQPPVADADQPQLGPRQRRPQRRLQAPVGGGRQQRAAHRRPLRQRKASRQPQPAEPVLAEQAAPDAGRGGRVLPLLPR
jgi:hypothetical protein